jgi:hypothetical protein
MKEGCSGAFFLDPADAQGLTQRRHHLGVEVCGHAHALAPQPSLDRGRCGHHEQHLDGGGRV